MIHRWLRFPQMFLGFPLRCQRAISEICGSSPKAAKVSQRVRGALSLQEGAKIVSRAAARLCERPRSLPTRATAPAGPVNHGAGPAGGATATGTRAAAPVESACRAARPSPFACLVPVYCFRPPVPRLFGPGWPWCWCSWFRLGRGILSSWCSRHASRSGLRRVRHSGSTVDNGRNWPVRAAPKQGSRGRAFSVLGCLEAQFFSPVGKPAVRRPAVRRPEVRRPEVGPVHVGQSSAQQCAGSAIMERLASSWFWTG